MAKIPNFKKGGLRYGAHFAVMSAFNEKVEPVVQEEPMLAAPYADFQTKLEHLDAAVKIAQGSEYTDQILKEDARRDRLYVNIKSTADMWMDLGIEPMATAARAVMREIDIYKIDVKAQYDQQTGLTLNFLQPFETPEMQAHVATLGLTNAFTWLKNTNNEFIRLLDLRGDERADNAGFELKPARLAVDESYDDIISRINALYLLNKTQTLETFIAQWSAEIARIKQQILNQKPGKPQGSGTGTGSSTGTGTSTGSGSETGTTDNGSGTGTTTDPTNPDNPGTGGGDNPSDPGTGGGGGTTPPNPNDDDGTED